MIFIDQPILAWLAITYFVGINLITIGAFWVDKDQAVKGEFRLSEANLLLLAGLGGTPGAYYARKRFRHKTRKQPFGRQLLLIALAQAAGVAALVYLLGRHFLDV